MVIGVLFISISLYEFYQHKKSADIALEEAQKIVSTNQVKTNETSQMEEPFSPEEDDVIGVLHVPKIDATLPIIEGTDEEMLEKGVGHYSTTVFPGENEQILLSGHRDTAFRKFGELEVGDRFIVEMPYGTYEYEMRATEIVGADDMTVIGPKGEEVLTLSTCYPFSYIGAAPDRYIIYAYPLNEVQG